MPLLEHGLFYLMPKIIKITQFKNNIGRLIDEMPSEEYFIVANETYQQKTFVVVTPDLLKKLSEKAGRYDIIASIDEGIEKIREKVSEKYRTIRGFR